MILFLLLFVLIVVVIIIFAHPKLSPIPYFPSNRQDLPLILKALNLQSDQTVIDLGAGDGVIVFEGAREALKKSLNTQFVAVEINPVLILIMHARRLFHPNRSVIHISWDDIFKMDYKVFKKLHASCYTIYLYVSPRFLKPIVSKAKKELGKFDLVTYFYSVKGDKRREIKGRHSIFIYES